MKIVKVTMRHLEHVDKNGESEMLITTVACDEMMDKYDIMTHFEPHAAIGWFITDIKCTDSKSIIFIEG